MKDIVLEVFEFEFTDDKTGEVLSNRTIKMTNSEIINELPESIITNRSNQMAVKKVLKGLNVKHNRRAYFMPPLSKADSSIH
ncbi:hypothetical protein [Bathymodiolus japonicus methanotrophic gill symbiont]|uniref:hypothetical protein n=1 Tax=Bathymodiolus japonicus methanotrophic gill symbiont TaxID=113269 RepID=UPI001C8DD592|nr:hypothetical protein [Bathymodiolus japonicus methanotrophic gill symbiont]